MNTVAWIIKVAIAVCLFTSSNASADNFSAKDLDRLFVLAAHTHKVPEAVLRSICKIESTGNPWAINMNGIGFQPRSKAQALTLIENTQNKPWVLSIEYKGQPTSYSFYATKRAAQNALNEIYSNNRRWYLKNPKVTAIRKLDMRSIDIGLMQINHLFHGRHFESKDALFDPKTNILYAAKYLRKLLNRHGTIKKAVAHYHSNTHKYQTIYLSHFWPTYQQLIGQRKKT